MYKILRFIIIMSLSQSAVMANEGAMIPPKEPWSFNGLNGTFDRAQLQRGFQVYKEVCSTCHSMHLLSYRNLSALGFTEDEIKAIAASHEVTDGPNDEGEMFKRRALPSDRFASPFANDKAARAANNGALPPDLSLITKARMFGPDYVHALLNGFTEAPKGFKVGENLHYNEYFPGNQIAMAPPLSEGLVKYSDGTPSTVEQMSKDVTAFLAWAAEPELEVRKQTGITVIIYLSIFTALMWFVMRKIWASAHKD